MVAKCAVPHLLESFSTSHEVASEGGISQDEVEANFFIWSCPWDYVNTFPNPGGDWCYPLAGTSGPGNVNLIGRYLLPVLLRSGIWSVTFTASLIHAGDPPDPFDPDTDCYFERNIFPAGQGFINDSFIDWNAAALTANVGDGCDTPGTGLTSSTVEVWIPENRSGCRCGNPGLPVLGFDRGVGSQISSWTFGISGTWESDFPP